MQYGLKIEPTLRDSFPGGAQPTATISANPRAIVKRNIMNPSSTLLARNRRYVRNFMTVENRIKARDGRRSRLRLKRTHKG